MWCNRCQQDIPAFTQPSGNLACFRCGWVYPQAEDSSSHPSQATLQAAEARSAIPPLHVHTEGGSCGPSPPHYDAWEVAEELAHIKRTLTPQPESGPPVARFELAHPQVAASHLGQPVYSDRVVSSSRGLEVDGAAWWLFLCGVTVFGCGSILLGWGIALNQDRLVTWGIPISVVGLVFFAASVYSAILDRDSRRIPNSPPIEESSACENPIKTARDVS